MGALIHTSALHYTKVLSLLLYSSTFYIQSLKAKTKLRESLFTTFDSYCIWYQTYWLTYDWWGHSMNTSLYCKWLRKSGWGFSHERGLLFPISFGLRYTKKTTCFLHDKSLSIHLNVSYNRNHSYYLDASTFWMIFWFLLRRIILGEFSSKKCSFPGLHTLML